MKIVLKDMFLKWMLNTKNILNFRDDFPFLPEENKIKQACF